MDEAVKTRIGFVAGFDGLSRTPPAVRKAGLTQRFAVIQDTHRPGEADMYYDEELSISLLEFASHFAPPSQVRFGQRARHPKRDTQTAPESIEVWREGKLVLFIASELWANVGGPAPYHDSYTYALYSNEDVASRLIAHLRNSDMAHLWMLSADIMPAQPAKKTILGRLWNLLG